MDLDTFWLHIERAREEAGEDAEPCEVADALEERLSALPVSEILAFEGQLRRRMAESYRRDLWAVGYVVNGGCSDDGFEYFRAWLVTQGRSYYEAALQEPERAADRADPESDEHECEELLEAVPSAYERVSGQAIAAYDEQGRWREVPGREVVAYPELGPRIWHTEDDLDRLFPDLCRRFCGDG